MSNVLFRFKINDEHFEASTFVRSCPLNMTGADFYALASDAYHRAIRRFITHYHEKQDENNQTVTLIESDFYDALANFTPSLDDKEIRQYERLRKS